MAESSMRDIINLVESANNIDDVIKNKILEHLEALKVSLEESSFHAEELERFLKNPPKPLEPRSGWAIG